jgi:hypothetical protein
MTFGKEMIPFLLIVIQRMSERNCCADFLNPFINGRRYERWIIFVSQRLLGLSFCQKAASLSGENITSANAEHLNNHFF